MTKGISRYYAKRITQWETTFALTRQTRLRLIGTLPGSEISKQSNIDGLNLTSESSGNILIKTLGKIYLQGVRLGNNG
jgi:hypothetical protein